MSDSLDAAMDELQERERYLDRLRQTDLSKMERRVTNWHPGHHFAEIERAEQHVEDARAAVRKAAREMGEEMTVETLHLKYSTEPGIAFGEDTERYRPGDRVRVVKVVDDA